MRLNIFHTALISALIMLIGFGVISFNYSNKIKALNTRIDKFDEKIGGYKDSVYTIQFLTLCNECSNSFDDSLLYFAYLERVNPRFNSDSVFNEYLVRRLHKESVAPLCSACIGRHKVRFQQLYDSLEKVTITQDILNNQWFSRNSSLLSYTA